MRLKLENGLFYRLNTPPVFEAPAQGKSLEFRDETYLAKLEEWGYLLYGENFIILTSTVFDLSTHVTEGKTDRRTGDSI